jgi:hypothetical protein
VFTAHATECKSPVDHAVTTGRSGDRSNQIALGDAVDLLPATVAACYWSGDCPTLSHDGAAVLSSVPSLVSGSASLQGKTRTRTPVAIANTALAQKAVTVLLV